ncbi:hypothetical protein D7W82_00695 [Corallococcus sp. CA049B]|uniref:hypothetical protein n=1 Tax=Corallococcus sp. CA049B TaxID=2316730 RepID=UPI000EA1577A|nr:hypothetical protein [Corallococcus sp. CA049B]NOJ91655.1 hypothetical protein [Corallococcus coralloides]RKG91378.1 hypothetical protein D7W82_00695 [Corallococcus sp. CA049B]
MPSGGIRGSVHNSLHGWLSARFRAERPKLDATPATEGLRQAGLTVLQRRSARLATVDRELQAA